MGKLNIAPTKSNLLLMKEQLAVSTNGYDLLEEKRELLVQNLVSLINSTKELETKIQDVVKKAYPAFIRMLMLDGADHIERLSQFIHYNFDLEEKTEVICGMQFSTLEVKLPKKELFYSLIGTDATTDETIVRFFELLGLLTKLASIRTIVWRLAAEVKKTQRRVNALDKMIIPQTKETKLYIESELEERERENIFVLKALKRKNSKKEKK